MNSSDIPLPLLERLRDSLRDVVGAKLRADATFAGPGRVYSVDLDYAETVDAAVREVLAADDEYFEDPHPWDVFGALAGGTYEPLIVFEVGSMTSSEFGLDTAVIGDRGYILSPGDAGADIAGWLLTAWEPTASQPAFEHAFIAAYRLSAVAEAFPPFNLADIGTVHDRVSPALLVAAVQASLVGEPQGWGTIFRFGTGRLPVADHVTRDLAIDATIVGRVLSQINGDTQEFRAAIVHAPDDEQRVVLYAYIRAIGFKHSDETS